MRPSYTVGLFRIYIMFGDPRRTFEETSSYHIRRTVRDSVSSPGCTLPLSIIQDLLLTTFLDPHNPGLSSPEALRPPLPTQCTDPEIFKFPTLHFLSRLNKNHRDTPSQSGCLPRMCLCLRSSSLPICTMTTSTTFHPTIPT